MGAKTFAALAVGLLLIVSLAAASKTPTKEPERAPASPQVFLLDSTSPAVLDGRLAGMDGGPVGKVAEWSDAKLVGRSLHGPQGETSAQIFAKANPEEVLIGMLLPAIQPVRMAAVQVDQDGSGTPSNGDVRCVRAYYDQSRKDIIINVAPELAPLAERFGQVEFAQVLWDGKWQSLTPLRKEITTEQVGACSINVAKTGESLSVEAFFSPTGVDSLLFASGYPMPKRTDPSAASFGVVLGTTDGTVLGSAPTTGRTFAEASVSKYYPAKISQFVFPIAVIRNVGVGSLELTQSVQNAAQTLPLALNKDSLARVFVAHGYSSAQSVEVTLEGYAFALITFVPLGTLTQTFHAPAGALSRSNGAHSANFELPDSWESVPYLVLKAKVRPIGGVDLTPIDNTRTGLWVLEETHDLTAYTVRVNAGSAGSPSQVATSRVSLMTSWMDMAMPMSGGNYPALGWEVVGANTAPGDTLKNKLTNVAAQLVIAHIFTLGAVPLPDQVHGFTTTGGGSSTPSWCCGSGLGYAAYSGWGSSAELTMAHEVNHNIGPNTWGRHVGNGVDGSANGCGASGPDADWSSINPTNTEVQEVGWNPTTGIVADDRMELMSYCSESAQPTKWISDYRWTRWFDRLESFSPGSPLPSAAASADDVGDAEDTYRVVTGILHAEGGGTLDPTFETPGRWHEDVTAPEPNGPVVALLHVEYMDRAPLRIPLTSTFEDVHGDPVATTPFQVVLGDGSGITQISLLDPNGRPFAGFTAGQVIADGSVRAPRQFERGVPATIGLDGGTNAQFARWLYSPMEGVWLSLGGIVDVSNLDRPLFLDDLPGGSEARVALQVSDGVATDMVESEPFVVPHLPPTVEIRRADRWIANVVSQPEDGQHEQFIGAERVATPIATAVGSQVSLRASAMGELGMDLGGQIRWLLDGSMPIGAGDTLSHTFARPGTYEIVAEIVDPRTGLGGSDRIVVQVAEEPGLIDGTTHTAAAVAQGKPCPSPPPWAMNDGVKTASSEVVAVETPAPAIAALVAAVVVVALALGLRRRET